MRLGSLLLPALAGHPLQVRLNLFRYRTLREFDQHVVFLSAPTGRALVFFAQLMVYSVIHMFLAPITSTKSSDSNTPQQY